MRDCRWLTMTLEEAIRHAEEVAENCDGECADEHRQLAEWLDELWRARKRIELLKILRDGFKADAQKYKDENDRLRSLLQDVAICASGKYCYGCPHQYDGCDRDERLRAEGIEVPYV